MAKIIHRWELEKQRDIKKLRADVENNPKSPELHFKLGNALLRAFSQDKKKEGLWHLEKAIRLKPDFAEAIEHLSIEIMEENPARGSRLAQNAASLYKASGNTERADELLNHAATHYVYDGWELLNDGMEKEALKKAERALKIYPDCIDAINICGSVYLNRFQFKEAEKLHKQAVEKAIEQQGGEVKIKGIPYWGELDTRPYMRARHGLGLTYIYLGKFKEALEQFLIMLDLNPNDNQGVRLLLGDVCLFMNDIEQAKKYYKEYGGENYALFMFITGKRKEAINKLKAMKKENPLIVKMLIFYLDNFLVSRLGREFNGDVATAFLSPYYKYLMNIVWNENVPEEMNYVTHRWFIDAFEFCKLYGPLWVKIPGTYLLLEEVEIAAT